MHYLIITGQNAFLTCVSVTLLLQASSQGPRVSAVVYAAAGRWPQHRSSGAVVPVQRVRRRLQIFRLTYLLSDCWVYGRAGICLHCRLCDLI